jgi:hypothetical protein
VAKVEEVVPDMDVTLTPVDLEPVVVEVDAEAAVTVEGADVEAEDTIKVAEAVVAAAVIPASSSK